MNKIQEFIGYGKIYDNNCLKIESKQGCIDFLNMIGPNLIVKRTQYITFLKVLLSTNNEDKIINYNICNRDKHEVEEFNDLNCNDNGKDGFDWRRKIHTLKNIIHKELFIHNIQKTTI